MAASPSVAAHQAEQDAIVRVPYPAMTLASLEQPPPFPRVPENESARPIRTEGDRSLSVPTNRAGGVGRGYLSSARADLRPAS